MISPKNIQTKNTYLSLRRYSIFIWSITNITKTVGAQGERYKSTSFGLWVGYAFDL